MLWHVELNTWILLIVALLNGLNLALAGRTHVNVTKVEKATNSMKDALVETTAKVSHAEGVLAGREAERIEAKSDQRR